MNMPEVVFLLSLKRKYINSRYPLPTNVVLEAAAIAARNRIIGSRSSILSLKDVLLAFFAHYQQSFGV